MSQYRPAAFFRRWSTEAQGPLRRRDAAQQQRQQAPQRGGLCRGAHLQRRPMRFSRVARAAAQGHACMQDERDRPPYMIATQSYSRASGRRFSRSRATSGSCKLAPGSGCTLLCSQVGSALRQPGRMSHSERGWCTPERSTAGRPAVAPAAALPNSASQRHSSSLRVLWRTLCPLRFRLSSGGESASAFQKVLHHMRLGRTWHDITQHTFQALQVLGNQQLWKRGDCISC